MLKQRITQPDYFSRSDYHPKNTNYYLQKLTPEIQQSLSVKQLEAIESILNEAIPKPSPKIVDLRFIVDLIFSKFYVVLFVGKERRQQNRFYLPSKLARIGNIVIAIAMLIGLNLLISLAMFGFAYLIKSALGIDFFPGHINEHVQKIN